MNGIELQAGDIFCVRGDTWLAASIRGVEWVYSSDNEATYGHAGIITSPGGGTLEALWTVQRGHLDHYQGQQIIIARPKATLAGVELTAADKERALSAVTGQHLGRPYPIPRLILFLLGPWVPKFFATGQHLVCSELDCKYLALLDARYLPYTGVNPDQLADEARRWRNIDVAYEGVWFTK